MKAVLALVLGAAASANALSACILSCQASGATEAGCDGSNYNSTTCYCDNDDFTTEVKACLYENSCDTDLDDFYSYHDNICGDSSSDSDVHVDTNETVADQGGILGDCILACQSSAASSAECSSSNYNETACYCDNDNFALDVKACLYQNCSAEVPVFYNYRADICDSENSTEYFSSMLDSSATATSAAATATGTAATTAATATADSTASGTAASASATGSSSGAVRDMVYVTGLAVLVAAAMMVVA